MSETMHITRRNFVRNSLLASAAIPLCPPAWPASSRLRFRLDHTVDASVVSSVAPGRDDSAPSDHLVLPPTRKLIAHASLPVLFALLSSEAWGFRPRSAIASVRYSRDTGKLLGGTIMPLSLGATGILDAAFLTQSRQMVVLTSAGILNVFQLKEDGEPGALVHVSKAIPATDGRASFTRDLSTGRIALDMQHMGRRSWYPLDRGDPDALIL